MCFIFSLRLPFAGDWKNQQSLFIFICTCSSKLKMFIATYGVYNLKRQNVFTETNLYPVRRWKSGAVIWCLQLVYNCEGKFGLLTCKTRSQRPPKAGWLMGAGRRRAAEDEWCGPCLCSAESRAPALGLRLLFSDARVSNTFLRH